ncbi:formamidopyrimidine-DNA glycosylase [Chitinophaga costaii]|uniref:Formamidopyrimidine-DNA glycosylase n=1 Tax=Chitinophaga costaii TaxID=1335309 RepID=A0A1C4EIT7_9BACT|nr:DNA-formamidopyrimidine glycosylase family protein [Chitinophaga costaii]PUZ23790.1 DNA-formamidopyrimidine glycosylase [Chitinophaga costaii]SCC43539.1 formamidopyrimidine-DNA glycosylase [Chitinophaga costaii]
MPELPDLQVFSHNLQRLVVGKEVKQVLVQSKKIKVPVSAFNDTLAGQTIKKVYRSGKELYFQFSQGDMLALHLMLRGRLHYAAGNQKQKGTVLALNFQDGSSLVMTDFMGAALPSLNPEASTVPDALELTLPYLKTVLEGARTSIKNILLDQQLIRGIGNAYADEILWDAGISPFSVAGKIPAEQVKILAHSIKTVLSQSEKTILKTHPGIIAGEVRDFFRIHSAKQTASPAGSPIEIQVKGGRKTYYTAEQILYK